MSLWEKSCDLTQFGHFVKSADMGGLGGRCLFPVQSLVPTQEELKNVFLTTSTSGNWTC